MANNKSLTPIMAANYYAKLGNGYEDADIDEDEYQTTTEATESEDTKENQRRTASPHQQLNSIQQVPQQLTFSQSNRLKYQSTSTQFQHRKFR